ncbi:MAG: GtrA family protein [Halobacteriaceae archaeon]
MSVIRPRRVLDLFIDPRLLQFVLVGGFGAIVDTTGLFLLHGWLHVDLILAKILSAEASIILMFIVNEIWTFAGEERRTPPSLFRRILTSNAIRLGGLLVATITLLILSSIGIWYVVANLIGIGVGFIVNYTLESILTWRVHRGTP